MNDATSKELVDAITALRSIYNGAAIGGNFENGTIALIARKGLGYPPDKCEHQNDFTDRKSLVTVCDDCGIVLEDLSPRNPAVELRRLQKRDLIATHHINRVTGHLKRLGAAIGKGPCDEGELVDAVLRRFSDEPPVVLSGWRCFHCDEVFTNWIEARNHFGHTPEDGPPSCKTTRGEDSELYHLKRRLELYQQEDTDLHRALSAKEAAMQTAVRRSEEQGYARGLEDAKKHPEELGLTRASQRPGMLPDQVDVLAWAVRSFGPIAQNIDERAARVAEEAIEIAQVEGVPLETIRRIADRVYSRPPGERWQEIGGTMIGILSYAEIVGLSMAECARREFDRVLSKPREWWQKKHAEKAAAGTADLSPCSTATKSAEDRS